MSKTLNYLLKTPQHAIAVLCWDAFDRLGCDTKNRIRVVFQPSFVFGFPVSSLRRLAPLLSRTYFADRVPRWTMFLSPAILFFAMAIAATPAVADTGWDPRILPRGEYRQEIQSVEIHLRPGRPMHFYGNTVRLLDQRDQTPILYRPLRRFVIGAPELPATR